MKNIGKIIIDQGDGWLAVDKPAGLSVHNAPGKDLVSHLEKEVGGRVHPVHRLDKETSGIILLATGADTLKTLSAAFREDRVKKKYLALVHGEFQEDEGRWTFPLAKAAGGRNNPAGKGKKLPSQTRYRVLERSAHYTLLDIDLDTGRTHQIRRHAKLAGHPVTGDVRYGSKRAIAFLRKQRNYLRMGLHAAALSLVPPPASPLAGPLEFTAPELPGQMARLLREDRA